MSNTENGSSSGVAPAPGGNDWECWQIIGDESFTEFVADIRSIEPDEKYNVTDLANESQLARSTISGKHYPDLAVELGLLESDGPWYYVNESSEVSVVLDVLNGVIKERITTNSNE